MSQHSTSGVGRGSRRAATVLAGVVASGAVAVAAGLGSAPTANATCASFFGIGNSANCTSNLTSIAIAIGTNATANAKGLFGAAFSIGNNAQASTTAGGLFNFATTIGAFSRATAGGIVSLATTAGSEGVTEAGAGPASTHVGNIAVNIGNHSGVNGASADGIGNLSANLFGDSFGEAIGVGNTSLSVGGAGTILAAIGYFNNVTNIMGSKGDIEADGGSPGAPAYGSVAFNAFGSSNEVYAGAGPLAVAGSIFQNDRSGPNAITKTGPGFNINGIRVPNTATAVGSPKNSPAGAASSHSKR